MFRGKDPTTTIRVEQLIAEGVSLSRPLTFVAKNFLAR